MVPSTRIATRLTISTVRRLPVRPGGASDDVIP